MQKHCRKLYALGLVTNLLSGTGRPGRNLWRTLQLIAGKRIKSLEACGGRIEGLFADSHVMICPLVLAAVTVAENSINNVGISLAG